MAKENTIKEQIEETMKILQRIEKAEANPFLYEKILNRMQQRKGSLPGRYFIAKRSLAIIAIMLLINVLSFAYFMKDSGRKEIKGSAARELINEYNLDESSSNL
jgi:hypothetical protein